MAVTTTFGFSFLEALEEGNLVANSDATSLVGGGIAVSGDHLGHTDVQILQDDGDIAGSATNLSGTESAISQLSNGNVVVATDNGNQASFTILDSTTGAVVVGPTASGGTFSQLLDVDVTGGLAGGRFVVATQAFFGGTDNDIRLNIHNNDGSLFTSFAVDATTANDQNPSVAALSDGGFVVGWHRNIGSENEVWYAVYEANGAVRKAPTLLDSTGTVNRNVSAVALDNGGFALAYEDNGWTPGDIDITLARFTANGTFVDWDDVSQNTVNDTTPSATVLSNGMIAIGSVNDTFSDTDPTWTLVDQNTGAKLTSSSTGFTFGNNSQTSVAAMNLGQMAAFFTDSTSGDVVAQTLQATRTSNGDAADDVITGDDLRDIVSGGGGADTIRGGANGDTLNGDAGNDTFTVTGAEVVGDIINGGVDSDRIFALDDGGDVRLDAITLTGIEEIEFSAGNTLGLSLTVAAAQIGAGLASNLVLDLNATGTPDTFRVEMGTDTGVNLSAFVVQDFEAGDRIVIVGDGDDETMIGTTRDDQLFGTGGDDKLVGHSGADYLSGGAGSDTASYSTALAGVTVNLSNAALNTGDAAGDTFNSIEQLIGSGFNDDLTGTAGANTLRGGAGEDILNGLAGNDSLLGGEDNDTLIGGLGADELAGGAGSDLASYADATTSIIASLANSAINTGEAAGDTYNSIERLTGSDFSDSLNGENVVNNTLRGGGGNDTLKGGTGNDFLEGGTGEDVFVFNTALNAATNVDTIQDFLRIDDTINIDDAIFSAITVTGTLLSGFFKNLDTGIIDANDRILYDQSAGDLFYDADGSGAGAAIKFAQVADNTALNNLDFFVV